MFPNARSSPGRAALGIILLPLVAMTATAQDATDPFEAAIAVLCNII